MTLQTLLPIITPLLVLELILMAVGLVDLARRDPARVRGPRWVWALVCILVGILGPVLYFIFGRKE